MTLPLAKPLETANPSDWIELTMETYRAGGSDVEVCKAIKTTLKKFNEMVANNPKFAELVEYGRLLSEAWWMEQARFALTNKQFNTPLWAFYMKNKFGWADKTENVERLPDELANVDAVRDKLMKGLPKLLKTLRPELTEAQVLQELSGDNR
jgi:hypothetical protein